MNSKAIKQLKNKAITIQWEEFNPFPKSSGFYMSAVQAF